MIKKIIVVLFLPLFVNAQTAFISGNDTICDNGGNATIKVDFTGVAPFTFMYSVNGNNTNSITTTINPYIINTKEEGTYTLVSYSDANGFGTVSSSGLVTVLESPTAVIHVASDTLPIIYTTVNFISQSIGNIISWQWDFGDNTSNISTEDAIHAYKDSAAIYQASLIVTDENGCLDTTIHNIWVRDEYWIYFPTAFTPDNDKINDKFCIEYNGIRENTFIFKVMDAQGDLMYQSISPSELRCSIDSGWDGKQYKTKEDLPSDTYVYEVYFQDFEGWKHKEYGTIILVR